jgi:hypothetical protein
VRRFSIWGRATQSGANSLKRRLESECRVARRIEFVEIVTLRWPVRRRIWREMIWLLTSKLLVGINYKRDQKRTQGLYCDHGAEYGITELAEMV